MLLDYRTNLDQLETSVLVPSVLLLIVFCIVFSLCLVSWLIQLAILCLNNWSYGFPLSLDFYLSPNHQVFNFSSFSLIIYACTVFLFKLEYSTKHACLLPLTLTDVLLVSLFTDEIMQQEIRPLLAVDIIEQLHRQFALLSGM